MESERCRRCKRRHREAVELFDRVFRRLAAEEARSGWRWNSLVGYYVPVGDDARAGEAVGDEPADPEGDGSGGSL